MLAADAKRIAVQYEASVDEEDAVDDDEAVPHRPIVPAATDLYARGVEGAKWAWPRHQASLIGYHAHLHSPLVQGNNLLEEGRKGQRRHANVNALLCCPHVTNETG
eukprot:CAMPEP_0114607840 /NCGR_PEP_ID=MMETSP0168-20121206/2270_1 /TAXON_ID=95228 ORGANISM="Vannella sp., Strain DIVA3 517/6/12" /NCGR_SAMPLE_ID=MMETSP0168 /ASSEMBLY_ACC=CAM_ASM_000044 /LENGTH=105 /DNA_ID=CAMNT_0001818719 /DNA_START=252 /DNA_END=569 /DNA_ORIENTATION=+